MNTNDDGLRVSPQIYKRKTLQQPWLTVGLTVLPSSHAARMKAVDGTTNLGECAAMDKGIIIKAHPGAKLDVYYPGDMTIRKCDLKGPSDNVLVAVDSTMQFSRANWGSGNGAIAQLKSVGMDPYDLEAIVPLALSPLRDMPHLMGRENRCHNNAVRATIDPDVAMRFKKTPVEIATGYRICHSIEGCCAATEAHTCVRLPNGLLVDVSPDPDHDDTEPVSFLPLKGPTRLAHLNTIYNMPNPRNLVPTLFPLHSTCCMHFVRVTGPVGHAVNHTTWHALAVVHTTEPDKYDAAYASLKPCKGCHILMQPSCPMRSYQGTHCSKECYDRCTKRCGVCLKTKCDDDTPLKTCQKCGGAFYCGRACQVAGWKAGHKKVCTAICNFKVLHTAERDEPVCMPCMHDA